jgi:hypothetical protein
LIADPKQNLIGADASEAASDTGELRRNWERGTYIINTPRTQAAMGWIGTRKISLADVDIQVGTRNATVAVQSLDDNPIGKSRAILISLGARAIPKSDNELPFYSEPVTGRLTIRAPPGLKLQGRISAAPSRSPYKYDKNRPTDPAPELQAAYKDGKYLIELSPGAGMHWLVLK